MVEEPGLTQMDLEPLLAMADLVPADRGSDRVEGILRGLTRVAVQVIRGAEAASLTLVGADGTMATPAYTGALADRMDGAQYRHGQGPCVDAARAVDWTAILVHDLPDDLRWQGFNVVDVTGAWARSVLSVSLFGSPGRSAERIPGALGSLNVYAGAPGAFGESQRDTALLLALYAALALTATEAVTEAGEKIDRLKEAMTNRTVIGQAQGILMERHKVTAGQAFDRLRSASMNLNRKLRDVAKDLSLTGEESFLSRRRPWPAGTSSGGTSSGVQGSAMESSEIEAPGMDAPGLDASGIETERVRAVARYDILDTPADGAFDRIAAIGAKIFGVPMATVSIVDTDRVWFKASLGLRGVREATRDPGLCASVILEGTVYQVSDARQDPRTAEHPLVTGDLGLQFYAAAPIVTAGGDRLGTVAVMDTEPHEATADQLEMLTELASVVMDQLELRLSAMEALRDGS